MATSSPKGFYDAIRQKNSFSVTDVVRLYVTGIHIQVPSLKHCGLHGIIWHSLLFHRDCEFSWLRINSFQCSVLHTDSPRYLLKEFSGIQKKCQKSDCIQIRINSWFKYPIHRTSLSKVWTWMQSVRRAEKGMCLPRAPDISLAQGLLRSPIITRGRMGVHSHRWHHVLQDTARRDAPRKVFLTLPMTVCKPFRKIWELFWVAKGHFVLLQCCKNCTVLF